MNKEQKEQIELNKESKRLREAYRKLYNGIRIEFEELNRDIGKLNKRFYELSLKIDNILEFIENFTKN